MSDDGRNERELIAAARKLMAPSTDRLDGTTLSFVVRQKREAGTFAIPATRTGRQSQLAPGIAMAITNVHTT